MLRLIYWLIDTEVGEIVLFILAVIAMQTLGAVS